MNEEQGPYAFSLVDNSDDEGAGTVTRRGSITHVHSYSLGSSFLDGDGAPSEDPAAGAEEGGAGRSGGSSGGRGERRRGATGAGEGAYGSLPGDRRHRKDRKDRKDRHPKTPEDVSISALNR